MGYFVVEDVEAVFKTWYATSFCFRIATMVVVVHERITIWTGIAELSTLLASHAISVEIPDVIPRAVTWSHGVALANFVVKHIERVVLVGCTTGFSLRVTAVIVVEHEGLAAGR